MRGIIRGRGFAGRITSARGDGWIVNHTKVQRLWREEGLRVPQRRRRKRHGASTTGAVVRASAPDRVWAVDFQFDVTTTGSRSRSLSIVDEQTRECLDGLVMQSNTAAQLIAELDRIAAERRAYPEVFRCDNGPELACGGMAHWAAGKVGLVFVPPGEPDNYGGTGISSRSTPGCGMSA